MPNRSARIRGIEPQPWEEDALRAIRAKKMKSDGNESGLVSQ
jgi:hypothetical protein